MIKNSNSVCWHPPVPICSVWNRDLNPKVLYSTGRLLNLAGGNGRADVTVGEGGLLRPNFYLISQYFLEIRLLI